MAAIAKKANSAVGLDIDAQVKSWRMNLDRIEQGIHDTTINYTGLNTFRGELFKLRADAEDFAKKLEPVLNSANEDVQALPPPPAQGQPPELEQAAITRADATAYLGYLTQANGAVDGTHNRVAKLLGSILDVRRSRVTNNLFHRQTGAFFPGTWKAAPGQITELAAKVRDAVKGWWRVQDQDQIMPLAGEALALWLGLTILSFIGARRLRRWEEGCEPPFWRRASDAANVILLEIVTGGSAAHLSLQRRGSGPADAERYRLALLLRRPLYHHYRGRECVGLSSALAKRSPVAPDC